MPRTIPVTRRHVTSEEKAKELQAAAKEISTGEVKPLNEVPQEVVFVVTNQQVDPTVGVTPLLETPATEQVEQLEATQPAPDQCVCTSREWTKYDYFMDALRQVIWRFVNPAHEAVSVILRPFLLICGIGSIISGDTYLGIAFILAYGVVR